MTPVQEAINNLKEAHGIGELAFAKIREAQKDLEKAQKDLEKPRYHKWEHGDIFRNSSNVEMIYISICDQEQVFCTGPCTGGHSVGEWLKDAEFLFNIKEKL